MQNAPVTEIVDWLQTAHGQSAVEMAQEALKSGSDPLKLATELDRRFSLPASYRTACALQAELRNRLVSRWGECPNWLLTRDGIEQATHPVVRKWRSEKAFELGARFIADIGCGLGFESKSFADAGLQVIAIERDVEAHAIASRNLLPIEVEKFDVVLENDRLSKLLSSVDSVFVDPARRDPNAARSVLGTSGNRISNPDDWSPSWNWVLELGKLKPKLIAKVAPGIEHDLLPADAHTYWFAIRGTLVEASVWFNGWAIDPGKTAIAVDRFGAMATLSSSDKSSEDIGAISTYVLDPSPAITRAGLVQQLAFFTRSHRIDSNLGFLSCDNEPEEHPLFTTYEVIDSFEFDEARITKALQENLAYDVQIIARGFRGDVEGLTKKLKKNLKGDKLICLLLARIGDKTIAILTQRVSN
ncbi:MAG: hypothetical protein RJA41_398 [Actinomycetota bacterium]